MGDSYFFTPSILSPGYIFLNYTQNTYSGSDSCSGEAVGAVHNLVFDLSDGKGEAEPVRSGVKHLSMM